MSPYAGIAIAAIVVAAVGGIHHHGTVGGRDEVRKEWKAVDAARLLADNKAILDRVADNANVATKQTLDNAIITKAKNEDLAPVHAVIAAAPRVRVGAAVCPGLAGTPNPKSAGGSDRADPTGRVVREDADRDIRALMTTVEDALATGRACQAFVQANGMAP